jgi:ribosomal protein S18 acetylase RimI-like enzyme
MEKELVSEFAIREGRPEDAVNARAMQAESWLATYPNEEAGISYEWVKNLTDAWLASDKLDQSREIFTGVINDPDMFYRLAERDGSVYGFVHIATKENGTKEFEAIYTSPETFGSGLGQQLMNIANQWIGGVETTLKVAKYNKRAIRFYEKNGFRAVEGTEELYREMIPIITMRRKGEIA